MMENLEQATAQAGLAGRPSVQQGHALDQVHEIVLSGCSPIPLANYLKALGILRLVAEQADPGARGFWRNDAFVLLTRLDTEALQRFFLEEYAPTPVLAPWNGGSGFYPGDNQSGIEPIENGSTERLAKLRDTIATIRTVLRRRGLEAKPEGDAKSALLAELRAELSDEALAWLDAAVVLTEESPRYPPLLGTGGNDGRLDFTNNFMQRVVAVIDPTTGQAQEKTKALLGLALHGEARPGIPSAAIGQFAPGTAGGPNQTAGFDAKALVNPWDFILMLEGALLFAAAATRRLEHSTGGGLSYPFTVRSTGAGSGVAALSDEANARAEIWMPLWETPTTLTELKVLLAEGRVTLGRRPVRDGLDFARAAAKLGVERGISGFQRYAFLMRSGKAYFATPLNRLAARRNRAGDIIDELDADGWLSRFRQFGRSDGSTRLASLVRRLEDALFALAGTQGKDPLAVQRVLVILGEAQRYLATSPKAREACPPVPQLSARWATQANDRSQEFDLAAALASLHALRQREDGSTRRVLPMRIHLAPEKLDLEHKHRQPAWDEQATHQVTWGAGRLEDNLIETLQRRLLEAERLQLVDKPFAFDHAASASAIAAWLEGRLDHARLEALVPGLMLVRIPRLASSTTETVPLPAAYRLLKPFFCTDAQLREVKLLSADSQLPLRADFIRRLMAGRTAEALDLAVRRLKAYGVAAELKGLRRGAADFPDGRRLLAALLVPLRDDDLKGLLPKPDPMEEQKNEGV